MTRASEFAAEGATFNVFSNNKVCFKLNIFRMLFFRVYLSWEGRGTLPPNTHGPIRSFAVKDSQVSIAVRKLLSYQHTDRNHATFLPGT